MKKPSTVWRIAAILAFTLVLAASPLGSGQAPAGASGPSSGDLPRTFLIDPALLAGVKAAVAAGDTSYDVALDKVIRDANGALKQGPWSVMDKPVTPPSGNKHDYLSQSTYYWPDPAKPDGLPYIYKDGQRNPEIDNIGDDRNFGRLRSAVSALAMAHYFSGDEKYAQHATRLLRAWFIDPATRMNPNMNHAQYAPGRNTGSLSGIIDIWDNLPTIIDAIGLIEPSPAWSAADRKAMDQWVSAFLDWMLKSDFGVREGRTKNNHSTFYDTQTVSMALYLGRNDLAVQVLRAVPENRIATQIEPDGRQPEELARTRAWHYSVFNLQAFFRLATLGDRLGIDLWNYQTADGRGIRGALDWLLPFATGDQEFTYREITGLNNDAFYPLVRQAAIRYQSPEYWQAGLQMAPANLGISRVNLTLPASAAPQVE